MAARCAIGGDLLVGVLDSHEFADVPRLRQVSDRDGPEAKLSIIRADVRGLDLSDHARRRPWSKPSMRAWEACVAVDGCRWAARSSLPIIRSKRLAMTASSDPRSRLRSTAMTANPARRARTLVVVTPPTAEPISPLPASAAGRVYWSRSRPRAAARMAARCAIGSSGRCLLEDSRLT